MTPHARDMDVLIGAITRYCPDLSVYVDCGAGDGYDCGVIKAAFPAARCIAIEPVEAWVVGDEVEKLRDVVAGADDYRVFHVKPIPGIHGLYSRKEQISDKVLALPALTLRSICEREGIDRIDAMKLDVEGAAYEVLAGMGPLLDSLRVLHVESEWIELFEKQVLEEHVFDLLAKSGMEKVWENRVEDLGQGDSIWVRR